MMMMTYSLSRDHSDFNVTLGRSICKLVTLLSLLSVSLSGCIEERFSSTREGYDSSEVESPQRTSDFCISEDEGECGEGYSCVLGACLPNDTEPPCIEVSSRELNFGTVRRGAEKTLELVISSCTDQHLHLARLFWEDEESTSFSVEPLQPDQEIKPYESMTILVNYHPTLSGVDEQELFILFAGTQSIGERVSVIGEALPPPLEEIGLHVQLEWDTDNSDIDLHLIRSDGLAGSCLDCHFRNRSPDWGERGDPSDDPFLDRDDTDGRGPEQINISDPQPGVYQVMVYYYSNRLFDNDNLTKPTISISMYGEALTAFELPTLQETDSWFVAEIEIPSYEVRVINEPWQAETEGWSELECGG